MKRVYVATWVSLVVLEMGCPVGGDAGVLHQALLKDSIKKLVHASCQPAEVWAECGPIQADYDDCMAACEEEMERRGRK